MLTPHYTSLTDSMHQIAETLNTFHHDLTPGLADLEQGHSTLIGLKSVDAQVQNLSANCHDMAGHIDTASADESLRLLIDALDAAKKECLTHETSLQTGISHIETELGMVHDKLTAAVHEVEDALNTGHTMMQTLSGSLTRCWQEIDAEFSDLHLNTTNLEQELHTRESETVEQISQFAQSIKTEFTQTMSDLFQSFQAALTAEIPQEFSSELAQLEQVVNQHYLHFMEEVQSDTKQFVSDVSTLCANAVKNCEQLTLQAFETTLHELIDETAAGFIQEIAYTLVDIEVGASVTTAVSEFLPALLIVKKALEIANALKSVFGL